MVKGTNRQVVLVKSPDLRLFEQAIFIVREEAASREGVTDEQILRQARRAADSYLKQSRGAAQPLSALPAALWCAAGAAMASAGWAVWLFLL